MAVRCMGERRRATPERTHGYAAPRLEFQVFVAATAFLPFVRGWLAEPGRHVHGNAQDTNANLQCVTEAESSRTLVHAGVGTISTLPSRPLLAASAIAARMSFTS